METQPTIQESVQLKDIKIEGETFISQQVSTLQSLASFIEMSTGPEDGSLEQFQKQLLFAQNHLAKVIAATYENKNRSSEYARNLDRTGAGLGVMIDYYQSMITALQKAEKIEEFAPGVMQTLRGASHKRGNTIINEDAHYAVS